MGVGTKIDARNSCAFMQHRHGGDYRWCFLCQRSDNLVNDPKGADYGRTFII